MEYVKLTVSFVKKLSVGTNARYADTETPGLQLRVSSKKISYYFRKRHNYKVYEFCLGEHPAITLEEARQMALKKLAALANYSDIDTQLVRRSPTVKEAIELWLNDQSDVARARAAVKYFIHLSNKKIADLVPDDIESVFYSMAATPYAANNAVKYLKTAITKVYKKLQIPNPVPFLFDGIKKYPTSPRKRVLSEAEAPAIIDVLKSYSQRPKYADQAKAILLMLYSGQRKSRVLGITVEQIDTQNHVWYVPGNDIKRPVELTLNDYAWEIVKKQIALRKTGHLFLWRGAPMKECRKTLAAICRDCNITNLHLHDLRRSLGSWMLSSGATIETVSKVLGHSSIRVTEQVYAHLLGSKGKNATNTAIGAMLQGSVD
ncbi:MAG: site-specific integrase [Lentisphaeria bacterium]|nr:site-specific integrase [Lentisphaeria bacterium]